MNIKTLAVILILLTATTLTGCSRKKQPPSNCPGGMRYVPAGEFTMGCRNDPKCSTDESPARKVTLAAFCIDTTEVTQKNFARRMKRNPSKNQACGEHCPVESVSWKDADAYCHKAKKRLPSEAEWEKAARGGTDTPFPWGASFSADNAWFSENASDKAHQTALTKANPIGLRDMLGNVAEWTSDCYDPVWLAKMPPTDPRNNPPACSLHTVRGGSFRFPADTDRVSGRSGYSVPTEFIGFRCAAAPKQTP